MYGSENLVIKKSHFMQNEAKDGGGGALLWGFPPTRMKTASPPFTLIEHEEQENSALYGDVVASEVHSVFMQDGSVGDSAESLSAEPSTFRVFQKSDAGKWEIDGGKPVSMTTSPEKTRYLKVALLDWYNQIVKSSTASIRVRLSTSDQQQFKLAGSAGAAPTDGVVTFDQLAIVGPPGLAVGLLFECPDVDNNVRGATFRATLRPCKPGEFYNNHVESCEACASGQFSSANVTVYECDKCDTGQYQNEPQQTVCLSCTTGTYQDETAQRNCKKCDRGKFTDETTGQTKCALCAPGRWGTDQGQCDACGAGRYSILNASVNCLECEAGKFQPDPGKTGCRLCAAGKTTRQERGRQGCPYDCEQGTFKSATDLMCKSCDAGFYSENGAAKCEKCDAGRYSASRAGIEESSGKGCTPCQVGRVSYFKGAAKQCHLCSPGRYAPLPGLKTCTACPSGKYLYERGIHTACKDCPIGMWSKGMTGATNCTFCQRGEQYKNDACTKCEPGFYSMHGWPYGTECLECPEGAICAGGASLQIKWGYWVTGGREENNTACDAVSDIRTCTHIGHVRRTKDGEDVNVCFKGERDKRTEYFDTCSIKRKIVPCGLQSTDPECELETKKITDCINFHKNTDLGCDDECSARCEEDHRSAECISCHDGPVDWKRRSSNQNSTEPWNTCNVAEGYGGRLCQLCRPGFAQDPKNRLKCIKCPEIGASYALIALGMFLAGSALAVFVHSHMEEAGSNSTTGATQKILLNYLQVVSIASEFPLKWPDIVVGMFQTQQTISTFSDQLMNFVR